MQTRYIFVTGGVFSGLGKGIIASSIGLLLKQQGYSVSAVKIDPYINFDAGTMRPTEHGEVWVTEDGGEIDQDLGNYERFLNLTLYKKNNITTGKIFDKVIRKERNGEYLGQTVSPIPHVTDEVKNWIREVARESLVDFVVIEIGGQVGDYENILFLEAARQMKLEDQVLFVHVGYLPIPDHLGEMKTKPLQHSVKSLQSLGIFPDFIAGRAKYKIDSVRKKKIAMSCSLPEDRILSVPDVDNIYSVPVVLEEQKLAEKILNAFGLSYIIDHEGFKTWKKFVDTTRALNNEVKLGIVGKYFDIGDFNLLDSYISVIEAVKHACWNNGHQPRIAWLDSKQFESEENLSKLGSYDGIIVPGGFGASGVEGKINAIKFCRENNIPFLGLCYGMQLAVIEFARNKCGMFDANTTEINPKTTHPVIDILPEQKEILKKSEYGASMRLGAYPAVLKEGTVVSKLYGKTEISERHRHRYEVNPEMISQIEEAGLVFSGTSPDKRLMEFIEIPSNDYFVATQAHPEFKSRPMQPAPLFDGLIKAIVQSKRFSQQRLETK